MNIYYADSRREVQHYNKQNIFFFGFLRQKILYTSVASVKIRYKGRTNVFGKSKMFLFNKKKIIITI